MPQTTTSYDAMLLSDIRGPVRNIVNLSRKTIAQFERKAAKVTQGRRFEFPLHVAFTEAVGVRAENIDLPDAQDEEYARPYDVVRPTYGKIEVTLDVMLASRNRKGAFAEAMSENTTNMVKRVGAEMNRVIHGTGDGKLAIVASNISAGDSTVTVESVPGTKWLRKNMEIDIWQDSSTLTNEKIKIKSVAAASNQFTTVSKLAATTASADAHIVRHAARDASGNSREQHGLQEIAKATGSIHNLNQSNYPEWASYVKTSVGVPTEIDLQEVLDNIDINANIQPGSPGQMAISTHGVRAKFFEALSSAVRREPVEIRGGFRSMNVDGLSLMTVDNDCQAQAMYVLQTPELVIYDMGDWDWLDQDGHYLSRTSRATFEATLYRFWNLVTYIRGSHGKLEDVTEAY